MVISLEKKLAKQQDTEVCTNTFIYLFLNQKDENLKDALKELYKNNNSVYLFIDSCTKDTINAGKNTVIITDNAEIFRKFVKQNSKVIFYGKYQPNDSCSILLELKRDMDKEYYIDKLKSYIHI